MIKRKGYCYYYIYISILIAVAMLLGACGENSTPTAASSTTTNGSSTSPASTTSVASGSSAASANTTSTTSSANTTNTTNSVAGTPAITGGPSTSGTAAVGATAGSVGTATSPGVSGSGTAGPATFNLPAIPNTTEVKLSQDNVKQILQASQLPASLTNETVKIFVSDDDPATLAADADRALTGNGYAFAIPGQNKPITSGDNTIGVYSKPGSLDLLTITTDPTKTFAAQTPAPGTEDITNQLKNRKSAVVVVGANGILQAIATSQGSASSTTTAGATAPAPSTTTTATPGSGA